ncbi:MAG: tRNA (guanosine(37)-N1)-methyltransferase TrmD [Patescibacteria group bacterium]|nr:tRNA (guanosine(37)-N1)-methyltransferase TrmD [Patescibacteria group bacterium]MBU1160669.1 tRNA (guanosine(37)-N1)-methyltransferase TrmD [Patescibacteria group bacterium]MBU1349636.1 tRNA (guanosine(37)-N1)-methyltransferase TrmD [Patescibacteria group bacterium]MBU1421272.1 tRNA (guanosine(37)-N1)-methyltransferase TrmD [Patescibacteria group bacterium]MBU1684030.1 tRNA (guanosine(37)-N1)-methyltransferase TrmD [Patescibacteria group bacterium]
MLFHIITIFPDIFNSYFSESIIKRAQEKNAIQIKIHNLRHWTNDKHKTVDDTPYGGGAGMIMKIGPIYKAIQSIINYQLSIINANKKNKTKQVKLSTNFLTRKLLPKKSTKIILLSAKGKVWDQQMAQKYSKFDQIILICGRYEGVDERVNKFVDEKISIGNYVLTGGEIPAMAIIDSITRLLPNVLGNSLSIKNESHNTPGFLEYPQYTRPEIFIANKKKYITPKILLSGNHQKIKEWKEK